MIVRRTAITTKASVFTISFMLLVGCLANNDTAATDKNRTSEQTAIADKNSASGHLKAGEKEFNEGFEAHKRQEYDEAFRLYRQSANLGYPKGYRYVGIMYRAGYGVGKNLQEANTWIEKAAELGDGDAQYEIASNYKFGKGIQANEEKANYWYRRSAKNGNDLSILIVKRLDREKAFEAAVADYKTTVSGGEKVKFEALTEVFCAGFRIPHGHAIEPKCYEYAKRCLETAGAKEDFGDAMNCISKPIIRARSRPKYRDKRTPAQKEREKKSISQLLVAYGYSGDIDDYLKSIGK